MNVIVKKVGFPFLKWVLVAYSLPLQLDIKTYLFPIDTDRQRYPLAFLGLQNRATGFH